MPTTLTTTQALAAMQDEDRDIYPDALMRPEAIQRLQEWIARIERRPESVDIGFLVLSAESDAGGTLFGSLCEIERPGYQTISGIPETLRFYADDFIWVDR